AGMVDDDSSGQHQIRGPWHQPQARLQPEPSLIDGTVDRMASHPTIGDLELQFTRTDLAAEGLNGLPIHAALPRPRGQNSRLRRRSERTLEPKCPRIPAG